MKVIQMDTTKEAIKSAYLEDVAKKTKGEWHSQAVHKIACLVWILDMLEVEDQAIRDQAMKQWLATPNSFGCNASALGQALGRESARVKLDKKFEGF